MITASINVAPLLLKLREVGIASQRPMRQLVIEQSRLLISSSGRVPGIIQVTPPFSQGTSAAQAKKQGERKVRRDIRRVYGLPSDLYAQIQARNPKAAAAFWAKVRAQDWDAANVIALRLTGHRLRSFDGGAAHASRRDKRGTVPDQEKSMYIEATVGGKSTLEAYINHRLDNVGTLASGFNDAAARLAARGVPAWVTRHGTRFSGVRVTTGENTFLITITNRVPFGQSDTIRRMAYVLGYRKSALQRQMPFIIRAMVKKAGLVAAVTS